MKVTVDGRVVYVLEGDNNEVSDEGVPCALPLEDLPFAIWCHLVQYASSSVLSFGVGGYAFATLVRPNNVVVVFKEAGKWAPTKRNC